MTQKQREKLMYITGLLRGEVERLLERRMKRYLKKHGNVFDKEGEDENA